AKRAGISQPYIYALFADKQELFLAVHDRVIARIREAFLEAARGTSTPEETLHAMGMAYRPLMEDSRYLSAQLQCFAAAAGELERTVNAYTLAYAVFLLTGSALGDRFGRRTLFVLGLGVFTAASAAAALAPSTEALIAARATQGLGAAIVTPLTLTLLSEAF